MEDRASGEDMDEEYSEGSQSGMEVDERNGRWPSNAASIDSSGFQATTSSAGGYDLPKYGSSPVGTISRGTKRSRGGRAISSVSTHSLERQSGPRKESPIPAIAKDMATQLGVAPLQEPDDLTLQTEVTMDGLQRNIKDGDQSITHDAWLSGTVEELGRIWRSCRDQHVKEHPSVRDVTFQIGPSDEEPSYCRAAYLGSLLLQLHHSPAARGMQAFAVSIYTPSSGFGQSIAPPKARYRPTAFPKVLFDWMEQNHNPYSAVSSNLKSHEPNATAHTNYWDVIFSLTLRGKLTDVISIFKQSEFAYARTARDEGQGFAGYSGMTLKNIKRVIDRAVQALQMCPALQDGDWELTGNDWLLFRKRIEQAMADLATFAEGRDRDLEPSSSAFEASNFGIKSPTHGLSQSARRAESRVPWTIYQNLRAMYGVLLGGTAEIIASAQDWVEATIGLTAWWDGDEEDTIAVSSLALTRRSLRKSQSRTSRFVDLNPTEAYLRRLALHSSV